MGFDADTGSVYLGRYLLMKDGVSDMRCMSEAYLVDDLKIEYQSIGR